MSNAKHDENGRVTMIGLDSLDGVTIRQVFANPITHGLKTSDGVAGSDVGNNSGIALLDDNSVSTLAALSSTGDGSIVNLYVVSATGSLLTKST